MEQASTIHASAPVRGRRRRRWPACSRRRNPALVRADLGDAALEPEEIEPAAGRLRCPANTRGSECQPIGPDVLVARLDCFVESPVGETRRRVGGTARVVCGDYGRIGPTSGIYAREREPERKILGR